MADKDDQSKEEERRPLRRRRAPSVVPDEETGERSRRILSEPVAEADDKAAPIKARRWWFRARSEPVAPASDLAETEARAAAARSAAAELRSRLKSEEIPELPAEKPAEPAEEKKPAPRRRRRTTEVMPPPFWQRHDLLVVLVALLLFAGGAAAQRVLAAPALVPIDELGLHVARPKTWLSPVRVGPPVSGLAAGVESSAAARPGKVLRHVVYQSAVAATARLEIRIAERPASASLKSALVLGRISRYGDSFTPAESTDRTIGGRDWVRTQYRYPFKSAPGDAPVIATAIEYATINGRLMYVVTVHGDEKTVRRLETLLVPTLKVDPNHPAAVGRSK
jgi:hypothetical protein